MQSILSTPGKENAAKMTPAFLFSPLGNKQSMMKGSLTPGAASSPIRRALQASQKTDACSPVLKPASPIQKTPSRAKGKGGKSEILADAARMQLKLELREKSSMITDLQTKLEVAQKHSEAQEKEIEQLKSANEELTTKYNASEQRMHELLLRRESLQMRLNEQAKNNDLADGMEEELKSVKQEFFYSVALAIKLSHSVAGSYCNFSAQKMFEKAMKEDVPFADYPRWIAQEALSCINEQIMDEVSI
mmetsp:Transcript_14340/g.56432  ORF Transcript_14340/g.56432 Transcript_14340/m.56432 type:complete len:247 (-) Transcript_14340:109-849(-)